MERNNVLLKITDLRQYFPVGKKKGLYVKANDGISLNIYEGETVGLVGESGCGKSTFGRTLLQLYRQTDGKTMYYGASRDELAPEYIEKTIRHLPHGLHELAALEKKRDEMQKVYDAADEQKRLHMHNDLTAAKKAANDAYLNIVGGLSLDEPAADLAAVIALASSYLDRPVPSDLVAIGEVGLTGELRSVNQLGQRVSEIQRLGFRKCVVPAHRAGTIKAPTGLTVIPARNIGEAIRAALRPAE